MLVCWRTGWLNDENVPAANVLLDLDIGFAIGERANSRCSQWDTDAVTDALSQLAISGTAEDLHLGLEREHNFGRALTLARPASIGNRECQRWNYGAT